MKRLLRSFSVWFAYTTILCVTLHVRSHMGPVPLFMKEKRAAHLFTRNFANCENQAAKHHGHPQIPFLAGPGRLARLLHDPSAMGEMCELCFTDATVRCVEQCSVTVAHRVLLRLLGVGTTQSATRSSLSACVACANKRTECECVGGHLFESSGTHHTRTSAQSFAGRTWSHL